MAQTGYTPILIYSSSTTTNAPSAGNLTNSTLGSELAINITDGKLFYKDNANAVQVIAWKTTPTTAGGTGLTSYTAGDLLYYTSGTTLSKLAIGTSGQWLGSSGTAPQWNSPAALTKTDDTNVTLTLGGSASTALLNAASLTLGWTGQLAVTRGGTGLATVAQGDILYGSASNTLLALAKNTTATRYLSNTGTSNNPAWAQVDLTNGVTGDLPYSNLAQGSALSVLGVTGNATADVASIAAGTDHQVLRRSGTSLAFGAVALNQAAAVTGTLPVGNGGTGLASWTATAIPYASASTTLANSKLYFDGTNTFTILSQDPVLKLQSDTASGVRYCKIQFAAPAGGVTGEILQSPYGGAAELVRNVPTGWSHVWKINSSEVYKIDDTANFKVTQTPGKYTVDVTGGQANIANNGTVDFSNSSGMLVVNNHTNGRVSIYLCGGGAVSVVGSVVAQCGTVAYVAGINGYQFTNNSGADAIHGFYFLRTRPNA